MSLSPNRTPCAVCFEDQEVMECLPCGHIFCHDCIENLPPGNVWYKPEAFNCPSCRTPARASNNYPAIRRIYVGSDLSGPGGAAPTADGQSDCSESATSVAQNLLDTRIRKLHQRVDALEARAKFVSIIVFSTVALLISISMAFVLRQNSSLRLRLGEVEKLVRDGIQLEHHIPEAHKISIVDQLTFGLVSNVMWCIGKVLSGVWWCLWKILTIVLDFLALTVKVAIINFLLISATFSVLSKCMPVDPRWR